MRGPLYPLRVVVALLLSLLLVALLATETLLTLARLPVRLLVHRTGQSHGAAPRVARSARPDLAGVALIGLMLWLVAILARMTS